MKLDINDVGDLIGKEVLFKRTSLLVGNSISFCRLHLNNTVMYKGKKLEFSSFSAEWANFATHPHELETYTVTKASLSGKNSFYAAKETPYTSFEAVFKNSSWAQLKITAKTASGGIIYASATITRGGKWAKHN